MDDVVGVIEIKLRGGGCNGRGRDNGKDNGVEEDGLKPLWSKEEVERGGDKDSLLGDRDNRKDSPLRCAMSVFFGEEFKTAAAAAAATNFPS